MSEKAYSNIGLGLILATFHINLGTLQIVPTFVGWILVAMGVDTLVKSERQILIHKSKTLSEVLVVINLLVLIGSVLVKPIGDSYLITIIVSLIELLFIYYFLSGVTEIFKAKGKIQLAIENARISRVYIILHVMGILIMCIGWYNYNSRMVSFLVFYMLFLRIYIICRVYALRKLCRKKI